jgi:quinol monooxygenase YgiN
MADTILVTGVMDIDPAKRDDFIAAVNELMAATRAEDGCEHYSFSADVSDEGRFYISEQWANQAVVDTHNATPHLAKFMGSIGELGLKGATLTMGHGAEPTKLF